LPRSMLGMSTTGINPPGFLTECRKRRLNHGSLLCLLPVIGLGLVSCVELCVLLYFCFVTVSQFIGCEYRLRNDQNA